MSKYNLLLTPASERDLKKLKRDILNKIKKKVAGLAENPEKEGKLLSHLPERWKNMRSARVGKYRILYTIEGDDIVIHAIKHRSFVYDILR